MPALVPAKGVIFSDWYSFDVIGRCYNVTGGISDEFLLGLFHIVKSIDILYFFFEGVEVKVGGLCIGDGKYLKEMTIIGCCKGIEFDECLFLD